MTENRGVEDRHFWVSMTVKVFGPVLEALSKRELKATMPVEGADKDTRYG